MNAPTSTKTLVCRAALGAMSRYEDVEALATYLEHHYVDRAPDGAAVSAVALAQPDQC